MQLVLQIFEYEGNRVRTVGTKENPLFVAADTCRVLGLENPSKACLPLSDKQKGIHTVDTLGGAQKMLCITESGLYKLIFVSRRPEAEKFQDWVTDVVLPQIRKTGSFALPGAKGTPKFIQRFNDNWDRTEPGYFSVINELVIRLYGRLEHLGYVMPDKGAHKREMRPDVSVGIHFSKWLAVEYKDHRALRKEYRHLISGMEVGAYQYENESLSRFVYFVDNVWIPLYAEAYFTTRDPAALPYLPKLLPMNSVPPMAASNQFSKIKKLIPPPEPEPQPSPVATEESAKSHFARMRA